MNSFFLRFSLLLVAATCATAQLKPLDGASLRIYRKAGNVELPLHIFNPPGIKPSDRRPAIVFFFGGGWVNGNPSQFETHAKYLAARGMVAISADYRTASRHKTTPFACIEDGKAAIRWVRAHAAELGIDPNRIAAAGGSAGGHVAASTATLDGLEAAGEDLKISSRPNALVLFNPVVDTTKSGYGSEKLGARDEEASPLHHLRKGVPPAIIFHGTADTTVPFSNVVNFCAVMQRNGDQCELVPFAEQVHGFFNSTKSEGRFYRETLTLAAGFLARMGWIKIGQFDASSDVGVTPKRGSAEFDPATGEYRVTGGGANIWAAADAFHFLWKRISGDVTLSADVRFIGAGTVAHRKVVLMVRQGLEPGSAHAGAALHGDGLTSLQYRPAADAQTLESRSALKAPLRVRIERRGNQFTLYAGAPGEELKPAGPVSVTLKDPVYLGLAVCSHDANILETAIFSNVQIETPRRAVTQQRAATPQVRSKISIYNLKDKSVEVIYTADDRFEAPNWSRDGKFLLVNSNGNLLTLPVGVKGAEPKKIDLGSISGCNNDHGISPDGRLIAFSVRASAGASQVYVANADGSNARLMTPKAPSYYHGWSPDGKWLAYTAQRDGEFDTYRMLASGGEEQRLTTAKGLDDGADYSPDGKWIYVNSDRTGNFDIWRFPADGSGPGDKKAQQVTNDEYEDWFPHPSPDGKWMVFVSFEKGTKGHPANKNVMLRMMPMPGAKLKPAKITVLTKLFGGQGTINVNSWSPDSQRFAFVSYELLPAAGAK